MSYAQPSTRRRWLRFELGESLIVVTLLVIVWWRSKQQSVVVIDSFRPPLSHEVILRGTVGSAVVIVTWLGAKKFLHWVRERQTRDSPIPSAPGGRSFPLGRMIMAVAAFGISLIGYRWVENWMAEAYREAARMADLRDQDALQATTDP